jgi:predicted ATP-binding protein involved in virulence
MLLSHLFLEGIGPFKTLHLDLRGNDAHASPGPHILAGVNGSGKSTVLKSIAWCLATADDGFPFDEWVLRRSLKRERRERKLGEKWAAILVPLPAASNTPMKKFASILAQADFTTTQTDNLHEAHCK